MTAATFLLLLAVVALSSVISLRHALPTSVSNVAKSSNTKRFSSEGRSWGGGRSSGGSSWGGGGRGGGRGGRGGRPRMDDRIQLKFSKTIKIDPDNKTPVAEMKFSPATRRVLEEKGFTELTPVQSQTFDYVFDGVDIVARSRTGTGKTLAFGLPLIEKIVALGLNERRSSKDGLPLILVLEPTRELAMQVSPDSKTSSYIAWHSDE
jgi:DEAD/DEAH box helicase